MSEILPRSGQEGSYHVGLAKAMPLSLRSKIVGARGMVDLVK
jgi:hypothetical protein